MIGHCFDLPDTLGGSEPQRASVSGVGVPLLQHQHFGQRRLDIGHCPPANRRPNHDPRHAAWFKTSGLWVAPKVARVAPIKGFHVSRVTRI